VRLGIGEQADADIGGGFDTFEFAVCDQTIDLGASAFPAHRARA
jgi:hypothetical protein